MRKGPYWLPNDRTAGGWFDVVAPFALRGLRRSQARSHLKVFGEARQVLTAIAGHQHRILDPHPANT
jgi:hypothetical protein